MTTEQITSRDRRLVLVVLVVAAACIAYTTLNFQAAFPEASIDLRLSKPEITALGEKFLRSQGLAAENFRQLTLFDSDETARTYLERELGVTEANRLMQGEVAVWRWRARWFRPPQQEEMLVYLSPTGVLIGFVHVIPEAAAGARLDKDAARRLAEGFLLARAGPPKNPGDTPASSGKSLTPAGEPGVSPPARGRPASPPVGAAGTTARASATPPPHPA